MNLAISEPSLFQLTQNLDQPLPAVSLDAETLKSYATSLIELVIEKQMRATIWVKLPQTKSWLPQIQKLQQEGKAENIYLCTHKKNYAFDPANESNRGESTIIPLKFQRNSILQRESFLIVLAPDFCSLILAQWQQGKITIESYGKRLQQPYLQMVSSFDPQAIAVVLSGIRTKIMGNYPFLSDRSFQVGRDLLTANNYLGEILLKQVKQQATVQTKLNSVTKTNHPGEKSSTILGLQEDFLNNLVQELRSPITHMKTALSLLESKQIKGEQRQRYLQMVSDECDRQNSLVGGLLEILQLDSPTEIEYLSLAEVVPGIVSTYQPLAEEKQVQLGYTISPDIPLIACPRTWFRQIIINLLNNSLQFTPPEGRVSVQAQVKNEADYVEILVQDTGIGIPSSEVNKIFQGFYRTKPTTSEKTTGAGLGLTLVQQLINRCGGSISVTSKVGKGTVFKILLPAVPSELVN